MMGPFRETRHTWRGFALFALAVAAFCCGPATSHAAFLKLENAQIQYYVDDYGWSDTWMYPPQASPDNLRFDFFSGDDAANLQYKIGGSYVSGKGWLTPLLDAGNFAPAYSTGSGWVISTPIFYTNGTIASHSVITQPTHGLRVTIDTSISGTTMKQKYTIKNIGNNTITDMLFADYMNFHPDSSLYPGAYEGKISYSAGTLIFKGNPLSPTFLADGYMHGDRPPDFWSMRLNPNQNAVADREIPIVENRTYGNDVVGFGPDDVAGTLAYKGPVSFLPNDEVVFNIEKGLGSPPIFLPEPGSLALAGMGVCLLGCVGWRRRATWHAVPC